MNKRYLNDGREGHGSHPTLKFVVEGRTFEWHEQYITDEQIRQVAGLSADGELYLSICEPWEDELVKANVPIDLARPGLEQFFIKRVLPYFINGVKFESSSQYIRGKRIRLQGNIPADQEIYLMIEKPWEDELIEDHTWVNLARPGIEQFVSRAIDHKIILIVNAKEKSWNKKSISFEEVVALHYGSFDPNPQLSYSVTYKNGPKENPDGIMTLGETLIVKNKMNFHVSRTTQS